MASRRKRWDSDSGTFVDDNEAPAPPQQENQGGRRQGQGLSGGKGQGQGNSGGKGQGQGYSGGKGQGQGNSGGKGQGEVNLGGKGQGQVNSGGKGQGQGNSGSKGQQNNRSGNGQSREQNRNPSSNMNQGFQQNQGPPPSPMYQQNQGACPPMYQQGPPPPMMPYSQPPGNMQYGPPAQTVIQHVYHTTTMMPPQMPPPAQMPYQPHQQPFYQQPQFNEAPPPYSPPDRNQSNRGNQDGRPPSGRGRGGSNNDRQRNDRRNEFDETRSQDGRNNRGRGGSNNRGRGGSNNSQQRKDSRDDNDDTLSQTGSQDGRNYRGRGGSNNKGGGRSNNRGRGCSNNSHQRKDSRDDNDDDLSETRSQDGRNNRGRGGSNNKGGGGSNNRGRGGSNYSHQRKDSRDDNDDNLSETKSQDGRNNRGRGRPRGNFPQSKGRGGRGNMQQNSGINRGDSEHGDERPEFNGRNNRGRGRHDGNQSLGNRGIGRGGHNNDRGRGGAVRHDDRRMESPSGQFEGNRGRGGYGNRHITFNRGGRGSFRRGFGQLFRRGMGNRPRNSSFTGSGEYSDCSASVFSDSEKSDLYFGRGRGRGGIQFPRRPRRGFQGNLDNFLRNLPQHNPIRNWMNMHMASQRPLRGRWSGLASRRGNRDRPARSCDDIDDSVSLVSEVSVLEDDPVTSDKTTEDIKLDDLFTIPLSTLKHRIKRHKKKLSGMKKNKCEPSAIKAYEDKLKLVVNAKTARDKEEKKITKSSKKEFVLSDNNGEKEDDDEDDDDDDDDDDHDDDISSDDTIHEISKSKTSAVVKRSHVIGTGKGRVSYQPKKNKKVKANAKKSQKPMANASADNVEDHSELGDSGEWEDEKPVPKKKQTRTKQSNISAEQKGKKKESNAETKAKKKEQKSTESKAKDEPIAKSDDNLEGVDEDSTEEDPSASKSKKSRNRNRRGKKKKNNSENEDDETGSTISSSDRKKLDEILNKLGAMIVTEKTDTKVSQEPTPGASRDDVKFNDGENDSKIPAKRQRNKGKKNEKKVADDNGQAESKDDSKRVEGDCDKEKVHSKVKAESVASSPGPDVNEVFKFMVKTLEGKGTPEEIVRESGLFPVNFDAISWFRRLKRRFTILERQGNVDLVFVFNRDASYCLDYIKNRSCDKPDCTRFHICKNLLSGYCMYGAEKCRFSHDFLDGRNIKISKQLGYSNVFTNEEICSILKVRYPHICIPWMEDGACSIPGCHSLHICPRFIYGKCLEGETCPSIHDKNSDHNKPIIDAYNMGKFNDSLFKKMIFVERKGASDDTVAVGDPKEAKDGDKETPEDQDDSRKRRGARSKQKTSISENSDIAETSSICVKHIVGQCKKKSCDYVHTSQKLPYVWQIKLFGTWVSVEESEEVEKCYCDKEDFSNMFQLLHNGLEIGARIFFKPYIRGLANLVVPDSDEMSLEARRLSTLSYSQSTEYGVFLTQWRWYWLDNDYHWQLFQPDAMQHTLEAKFLAKQREYNYSRENFRFKYTISFDAMTQTNIGYGTVRNLVRRPLFVSSIDVQENRIPESLADAPEINVPLPENWVPWDVANPFELVRLNENDPTYIGVSASFYKTLNPSVQKITGIFRVQNHKLWALFKHQEEHMQSNYQRVGKNITVDKRQLFHGTTTEDAVHGISINNFDIRVSGTHGTVYGDGAYFARDAKYSHNYTKRSNRLMFVASVLVGQYTTGNKSYRRPPEIPGNQHELYDSCVDNVADPKIFILFDRNQFYPHFLIKYQDINDGDDDFNPSSVPLHSGGVGRGAGSSTSVSASSGVSGSGGSSSGARGSEARSQPPPSPQTGSFTTSPKKKDDSCSIQ